VNPIADQAPFVLTPRELFAITSLRKMKENERTLIFELVEDIAEDMKNAMSDPRRFQLILGGK
jgi:hypothetical protein